MRVVYLNPVGDTGGAERSLLQLLAEVQRTDPSIERYLILGSDGPLRSEAEKIGVSTEILPLPRTLLAFGDSQLRDGGRVIRLVKLLFLALLAGPTILAYLLRLRRRLRELSPMIIHSNGIKTHVAAAVVRPRESKLIWHIRDFLGDRPLVGGIMRKLAARATLAVANSDAVRDDALAVLRSLSVIRLYNAIDTRHFTYGTGDTAELDRLAGFSDLPADSIRVGLVATYARWKGQETFIESAALVMHDAPTPPIYFYIVGGSIYRTAGSQYSEAELRAIVGKHGLVSRFGFVPFQSDPVSVFQSLDIVVQASTRREPFGLTIVEAMACGRATAVALAGGAAEIVENNVNGLGFRPGDAAELAEIITTLATDASLRERLGQGGRATAIERFSAERLGKQFTELYRSLGPS